LIQQVSGFRASGGTVAAPCGVEHWMTMIPGQVSLSGGTVQTMCKDQFGNWVTGCVEVIALVGACLDVFWFDPLKRILIAWRRVSVSSQIAFQVYIRMLEMPSFFL